MALDLHVGQGKDISGRASFPIENLAVTGAFKPRTSLSCRIAIWGCSNQTRMIAIDEVSPTAGSPRKKETPKDNLGGKRKAVFGGYAGWSQLGLSFEASQPVTLDLSGFGGA
jgi:hypothetical protein